MASDIAYKTENAALRTEIFILKAKVEVIESKLPVLWSGNQATQIFRKSFECRLCDQNAIVFVLPESSGSTGPCRSQMMKWLKRIFLSH